MIAPEPIFEPRGTPFSVVGRMKALSDLGHEVDLLTYPMGGSVPVPGVRIFRVPRIPGIRKVKIGPSYTKLPLDFLLLLYSFFRTGRKKYDLIHTHEEAGFWGVPLSRIRRIPHVYDMHSSLPQQLRNFQFTRSGIVIGIFRSLERWVLRHAGGVIAICEDLYRYACGSGYAEKTVLIENVIDYGMIFGSEDRSEELRKKYGLDNQKVALYTGTFEAYQGLDLLIQSAAEVVKKVPRIRFLLVGGHPRQVDIYREMARAKGLESYFIFTGQVQPQEIDSYIRCADVLLSPRTAGTNTPLKIYAYLRSGVPVVATRLATHTQVLNDEIAFLAEPTPEAFSAAVLNALLDKKWNRRVTGNARRISAGRYSYGRYLELLNRVMMQAMGNT